MDVTVQLPLIASGSCHNTCAFMNDPDCQASCSHVRLDVYLQKLFAPWAPSSEIQMQNNWDSP